MHNILYNLSYNAELLACSCITVITEYQLYTVSHITKQSRKSESAILLAYVVDNIPGYEVKISTENSKDWYKERYQLVNRSLENAMSDANRVDIDVSRCMNVKSVSTGVKRCCDLRTL